MKLGAIKGRHHIIPVNEYVLEHVEDPTNIAKIEKDVCERLDALKLQKLDLYITGLTAVTIAVFKYCIKNRIDLTFYHFNIDTKTYFVQKGTEFSLTVSINE